MNPSPAEPAPDSLRGSPPPAGDREAEWDALVSARPEGTFFHTRAWARIVVSSFPALADESVRVETPAGPLLLPLFSWSRAAGLLRTRQSSFPFLYGGPIPGAPDAAGWRALAGRFGDRFGSWRVTGNPFAGSSLDAGAVDAFFRARGFRRIEDSTCLLRLPADEAGFWDGVLTTSKRNDVRRLDKKGVAVEETRASADVEAVYRLYLASFARWGGRPRFLHPPEFYHNLLALGGPHVRLTVARHEGRLLGGAFTVRWNGKAHYLAGYFDSDSRALRPNVLIQIESILRAIRDRLDWYDFLPSGGHASVEEFKSSLGGRRVALPVWVRTGALHRLLRRGSD